jgi:Uma2 family endonuclease
MLRQIKSVAKAKPTPTDRPRMTYARFLDLDGENQHVEWVNGEVIEMPPVSDDHSDVQGFFHALLRLFAESRDLGAIRTEPFQMKTAPELPGRAPDVLFVAKKNLSRLKKNHLAGAADLVIEIISPGTGSIDRGDKYFEYEKGGVREYWLIDPARKQAEFYLLGRDAHYHLADVDKGEIFRSVILKGLWLKVAWLWQRPLPSVLSIAKEWKLV